MSASAFLRLLYGPSITELCDPLRNATLRVVLYGTVGDIACGRGAWPRMVKEGVAETLVTPNPPDLLNRTTPP